MLTNNQNPVMRKTTLLGLVILIINLFMLSPVLASTEQYTCPMHPHYIATEPGSCPICGMDLVAVEVEEEEPAGRRVGERVPFAGAGLAHQGGLDHHPEGIVFDGAAVPVGVGQPTVLMDGLTVGSSSFLPMKYPPASVSIHPS